MPGPSKPQIKINALARLVKEYEEYEAEKTELESRLVSLDQAVPKDEYEIRRAQQVLDETTRVMHRVAQSIKEHSAEVNKLGGLKPDEEKQAKQALESASAIKSI